MLLLLLVLFTLLTFSTEQPIPTSTPEATAHVQNTSVRNGKIAFASTMDGDFEIYTISPDGSNLEQLTNNEDTDDLYPDWSPDGTKIVFVSYPKFQIFTMNADGTNVRELRNMQGVSPKWSSDGTKIAFISGYESEIFVVNSDGTHLVKLTNDLRTKYDLDWSPDDAMIAYTSYDLSTVITPYDYVAGRLCILTLDSRNQCFEEIELIFESTDWSPDGSQIMFQFADQIRYIGIVDKDGTDFRQLGKFGPIESSENPDWKYPVWSPDGTKIAAVSHSTRIDILNPDATEIVTIFESDRLIEGVSWQPIASVVEDNRDKPTATPAK